MRATLILTDDATRPHCAWCQRTLGVGERVTMEGRLTVSFGALYCTTTCLQAHRSARDDRDQAQRRNAW